MVLFFSTANGGSGGGSTGASGQGDTCYHCSPVSCQFTTNTGGGGGSQTAGGARGQVSGSVFSYYGVAGSFGAGGAGGNSPAPGWGKVD